MNRHPAPMGGMGGPQPGQHGPGPMGPGGMPMGGHMPSQEEVYASKLRQLRPYCDNLRFDIYM